MKCIQCMKWHKYTLEKNKVLMLMNGKIAKLKL